MDPGKKYNIDTNSRPAGQIYSIGIPLLLVTFIAVCLIVLSAGAYVTARQDYSEAGDQGSRAVSYQVAVNRAEEACQAIDTGGTLPERTTFDQEKGVITVRMKSGRKLEAGVSQNGGKHRIPVAAPETDPEAALEVLKDRLCPASGYRSDPARWKGIENDTKRYRHSYPGSTGRRL